MINLFSGQTPDFLANNTPAVRRVARTLSITGAKAAALSCSCSTIQYNAFIYIAP